MQIYSILIVVMQYIPYIGNVLAFIYYCYWYCFHIFRHRMRLLTMIECSYWWCLGLGTPLALISMLSSAFATHCIFSLSYPIYLVISFWGRPRYNNFKFEYLPKRLKIFRLSDQINSYLIEKIIKFCRKKSRN